MMNSVLWICCFLALSSVKLSDAAKSYDVNLRARYYAYKTRQLAEPDSSVERVLGLPTDCKLIAKDSVETAQGTVRQKYQETYQGIPIADTVVDIDVDADGNYEEGGSVGGKLIFKINEDITDMDKCIVSFDDAYDTALTASSIEPSRVIAYDAVEEIYVNASNKAHLVWKINLMVSNDTTEKVTQHLFRIDRCNKEVIQHRINKKTITPGTKENVINEEETLRLKVRQGGTGSTESWTSETTEATTTKQTTAATTTKQTAAATTTTQTTSATTTKQTTSGATTQKSTTPKATTQKPTTPKVTTQKPTTPKVTTQKPTTKPTPGATCDPNVGGFGGNTKTGKYAFGVVPRCLDMTIAGNTCTLANEFVKVVDMKTSEDENNKNVVTYPCDTIYQDEVNGAYSPVLDALFHGTETYQMLKDWYKYTPLKTARYILVHFGVQWANAMLSPSGNLVFGDGDDETFPMVNLDTVAHEAGHGITEQTSNLEYTAQSGGTDEAFCDIMGEVAEAYVYGQADWFSGFYDAKGANETLRYFDDPTKDGVSIKHVNSYTSDMNVHYSSGVINRMFYVLVKTQNIPIRYAFEPVLTANRLYWRANSDFEDVACGVMRAALDHGLDTEKFRSAFNSVGIQGCSLTKYLVKISASKPRTGITISGIIQPIFLAVIPTNSQSISVTVQAPTAVSISLSKTLAFSTTEATGSNSVTYTHNGIKQLYIRLGDPNQSATTGTLTIKYT